MQREVFDKYRGLIFKTSGILLKENKQPLLIARLGKRMRALGIGDFGQYYQRVVSDETGRELGELVNAISTNVTNFFRENQHFDFLARYAAEWAPKGAVKLRGWCAACSTGEEPYSIAFTLLENLPSEATFEIVASDISTKVLQIAKFGAYRDQDLAKFRGDLLKRYFQIGVDSAESFYRVKENVRSLISFRQINLSTPPFAVDGQLDFIFCRNVMIYFDQHLKTRLLDQFHSLLKPDGLLFVGLSESLGGNTPEFINVQPSVYRKRSRK